MFNSIATFLTPIFSIIEKAIPDQKIAADTKIRVMELAQNGELESQKTQLSAIVIEGGSQDKWTSRARPSFLYVIYIMILASIPMGIINAFSPVIAHGIASGMKDWLGAIPAPMWQLFGIGYLGYVAGRSYDKKQLFGT